MFQGILEIDIQVLVVPSTRDNINKKYCLGFRPSPRMPGISDLQLIILMVTMSHKQTNSQVLLLFYPNSTEIDSPLCVRRMASAIMGAISITFNFGQFWIFAS